MITREIFKKYIDLGLSCIPCKDKRPTISSWKDFQVSRPNDSEIARFHGEQIAIICGKVSGGLVCIDFDIKNGNMYDDWLYLVNQVHPEVLSKLVIEKSPSGGYHAVFKTNVEVSNVKLAKNENGECTIETRGEGGYFVCYPSPNYTLEFSDLDKINILSDNDSKFLLSVAASLNKHVQETIEPKQRNTSYDNTGLSPFDDFDSRVDVIGLLQSYGWSVVSKRGETVYLKRPNKTDVGISATWNHVPNRFYCFTTGTVFENDRTYKPSAIYSILSHSGNFGEAAKALYQSGYGERRQKLDSALAVPQTHNKEASILNVSDVRDKIFEIKKNGYQRGKTTGWKSLDQMFSIAKRQLTIITGVPSAGKSEFMDALSVNLMVHCDWKFGVFSPENYPAEMHYHKLIEKICGNKLELLKDEDVETAIKIINDHFFFIDALEDDLSLEAIFDQAKKLVDDKKIDGLIIDPWNEVELSAPSNTSESTFIGNCLRKSRKFARRENIHLFIIAHPTKLTKNKDGEYPIPELWDISGSAHWRNKADNGICVHRDYKNESTVIFIQKVKFKYFGRQGECELFYEGKSGRYLENKPFSNDDNYQDRFK